MDSVQQYILSIVCMSIICAVVQMLCASGTAANLVKMVGGILVAITVLQPLMREPIFHWEDNAISITQNGEQIILDGQQTAEMALSQLIKDKTQTYILNKASEMGADITVEVILKDECPMELKNVTMKGTVAPYIRQQLAESLYRDLGIAEENQIWIS